jgi:hypothetical protein
MSAGPPARTDKDLPPFLEAECRNPRGKKMTFRLYLTEQDLGRDVSISSDSQISTASWKAGSSAPSGISASTGAGERSKKYKSVK